MSLLSILLLVITVLGFYSIWKEMQQFLLTRVIAVLILFVLAFHFIMEGYDWRFLLIYFISCSVGVILLRIKKAKPRKWVIGILGFFYLISILPLLAFPIFNLPQPSGNYPVGVKYFAFTDSSRLETFSEASNDFREVTAKVWYPAKEDTKILRNPYLKNINQAGAVMAESMGLPSFIFNHLSKVKSNSFEKAEILNNGDKFPLLIFSHGWGGFFGQNTVLMEELASQGYVIVSIAHHYDIPFTIYPNGSIKIFDRDFKRNNPELNPESPYNTDSIFNDYLTTTNENIKEQQLIDFTYGFPGMQKTVYVWAEDIKATVDYLERRERRGDAFFRRLDFDRIGYFGMSFGGASSGQACLTDSRCKAAINMDGTQFGDMLNNNMDKPMMFMQNGVARDFNNYFVKRAEKEAYSLIVENTQHFNFTDFSIYSPLFKKVGFLGSIEGYSALEIMNRYTLAFFNKHLKGKREELLNGTSSEFSEVVFQKNEN